MNYLNYSYWTMLFFRKLNFTDITLYVIIIIFISKGEIKMSFNKNISGYKNEEEFANYLNNKKISELNPIFQELFQKLYGDILNNNIIKSWVSYDKRKADIYVKIGNEVKGISIKKGVKNSVHMEHLDDFCNFLTEIKIPNRLIDEVKFYHYADGTIDGTGEVRQSINEYKNLKNDILLKINSYFNKDEIIEKAIKRFVLQGNNSNKEIDAIIYGVIDDFIWITNEEIKYIIKFNKNIISSSLHFGSLYYQPLTRNIIRNPKYEYKREYIQIKWYNISDDIIRVMANYRNT